MTSNLSSAKRNSVQVKVTANYLVEQSQPANRKFVYSYTIEIRNQGNEQVQLLSRYWHITDGNNQVQEVQGVGVVGEQPKIKPGESYTYTSGAVLETPSGLMKGHYTMLSDNGTRFDAEIPPFALVQPQALH
ncbi:ApaG protein [Alteromonadaceae bacterium 2753L.S.0a.02]|nr:ApaG protein [Alteromonadaceae bacterium 2753L.S.0a.02]